MTTVPRSESQIEQPPRQDANELREDIESTRAELGRTVDQHTHKLDVEAQARHELEHAKSSAAQAVGRAKRAAPEPVQHGLDKAGQTLALPIAKTRERARPHRSQILLGAGVVAAIVVIVLRRRS
jgi:hypothetical protein